MPGAVDPRRPSQNFRQRRIIQNDLVADYDAVSIIFRKRMSHGLQADAHYTWSSTRDMATHSNGGGKTMDNYDIWRGLRPANWDIPHRFVASYLYDMPFFGLRRSRFCATSSAAGRCGVTTLQSGSPVNVTHRAAIGRTSAPELQRPNLIGPVPEMNCQPNSGGDAT